MNNKAYDLESYSFSLGEQILIDTNVWLYLFPAPGNPPHSFAQQYSTAFANLVSAQAQPVLDPMVLSEYLNRYIRIEWEGNYRSRYPNFKGFRNSADFSTVASSAETFAKRILSFCQIHSIPANELDLSQALADFSAGGVDFNDALLVDICKKRNIKLMTSDGDFQDGGIEVLTTNPLHAFYELVRKGCILESMYWHTAPFITVCARSSKNRSRGDRRFAVPGCQNRMRWCV